MTPLMLALMLVSSDIGLSPTTIVAARLKMQPSQGQTPTPVREATTTRQTDTARASGCVRDDRDQALPGAVVTTLSRELRQRRSIVTGPDGCFALASLPAGAYQFGATKSGYLRGAFGQTGDDGTLRPDTVQLAANEAREHLDITLARGGVVVGHVYDATGRPMTDVSVQALQLTSLASTALHSPARPAQTDDIGEFRIFGLPPGTYCLLARPRPNVESGTAAKAATGYPPTFAPNVLTVAEALRISVAAGQETPVDIQLSPTRLFTLTGTAVASTGSGLDGSIRLLTADGRTAAESRVLAADGGRFSLAGVPAGAYTLSARSGGGTPGGPGAPPPKREYAVMPTVVTGDTDGLTIATRAGANVPGELVFEGAAPPTDLAALRILARPVSADSALMGIRNTMVDKTGRFVLDAPPEDAVIDIGNIPDGWMLKSVTYRGHNIAGKAITFAGDGDRLHITLTNRLTILTGTVQDGSGNKVAAAAVIVTPADNTQLNSDATRVLRLNRDGMFTAKGLLPGTYLLSALENMDGNPTARTELLDHARASGQRVTLDEGETKTITVKVSM